MTQRGYDIVTMQKLLVVENTFISLSREESYNKFPETSTVVWTASYGIC